MLKPLSERVAISNLANAAMFQGDVADEARQATTIASDDIDPTPKVASSNLETIYAFSSEGCYAILDTRATATRSSLEGFL